jgi:hypothetical protein
MRVVTASVRHGARNRLRGPSPPAAGCLRLSLKAAPTYPFCHQEKGGPTSHSHEDQSSEATILVDAGRCSPLRRAVPCCRAESAERGGVHSAGRSSVSWVPSGQACLISAILSSSIYAYGTLVQRPPGSCQAILAADSMGRWGEDGLAGISHDKQRRCFSLALWNGQEPIAPAT